MSKILRTTAADLMSHRICLSTLLNIQHFLLIFFSLCKVQVVCRQAVRVGKGQTGRAGWGWEGQRSELHNDCEQDTTLATPEYLFPFKKSLSVAVAIGQQTHCGLWSSAPEMDTHTQSQHFTWVCGQTDGRTDGGRLWQEGESWANAPDWNFKRQDALSCFVLF